MVDLNIPQAEIKRQAGFLRGILRRAKMMAPLEEAGLRHTKPYASQGFTDTALPDSAANPALKEALDAAVEDVAEAVLRNRLVLVGDEAKKAQTLFGAVHVALINRSAAAARGT